MPQFPPLQSGRMQGLNEASQVKPFELRLASVIYTCTVITVLTNPFSNRCGGNLGSRVICSGHRAREGEPRTRTLSLCPWRLCHSEQGGPRPGFRVSLCTRRTSVSLRLNLTCKPTVLPERGQTRLPHGAESLERPAGEKQMLFGFFKIFFIDIF